jgi:hypothetical protein
MAARSQERESTDESSRQPFPQTAAALIYQYLDSWSRISLASASRWTRDIVLREARIVTLHLHSKASRKPLICFLNRVCTSAQRGLCLTLEAHGFDSNSKSRVLSDLFAPAKRQGGWASVTELTLEVPE